MASVNRIIYFVVFALVGMVVVALMLTQGQSMVGYWGQLANIAKAIGIGQVT